VVGDRPVDGVADVLEVREEERERYRSAPLVEREDDNCGCEPDLDRRALAHADGIRQVRRLAALLRVDLDERKLRPDVGEQAVKAGRASRSSLTDGQPPDTAWN